MAALVAIESGLVAGALSFGVVPIIVDGFVRLGHLDLQSAGLCVTAEMAGQSVGAASALALLPRIDGRKLGAVALALITLGNALTIAVSRLSLLLLARGLAGIGCGVTAVFVAMLAKSTHAERNFGLFNAVAIASCAVLANAAPTLYRVLGSGGIFAALGGTAALCSFLTPVIPSQVCRSSHVSSRMLSPGKVALVCATIGAYFIAVSMIWSYAGEIGVAHRMSAGTVSRAVSRAWIVGGLSGSAAAIVISRRLPRSVTIALSAVGTSAATCATIMASGARMFAVCLDGFVFFWIFSFPVQMAIVTEIDGSGRLPVAAYFVQLVACAIGPAVGGRILLESSYDTMALVAVIAYAVFLCCGLGLVRIGKAEPAMWRGAEK